MRRNRVFLIGVVLMCMLCMTACSSGRQSGVNNKKINVICTTFPLYDWTRQMAGDNINVELLLDKGVDMHSFQASATDIAKITSCDVLIYVGGISDVWITDALKNKNNPDMQVVNLMEDLKEYVKAEEYVEGMQSEHEEHETHEEEGEEWDEHIWLSVKNAAVSCEFIKNALCAANPEDSSLYEEGYKQYIKELKALDDEYENVVSTAARKTLLFADRFPFRYLMDDYGINYYAAFPGCSSETNASFQTVTFLAEKLDEEKLPAVLVLENSENGFSGELAQTIISNSSSKDCKILKLNSMQAVSSKELNDNITYISIMRDNMNVFKEALN